MLDLLLSKSQESFPQLETKLRRSIQRQVAPFARDRILREVEDVNSLYNIALLKLHEAMANFAYDPSLDEKHNEGRFLAMLSKYIKNAMIDVQYAAKAGKRRPKECMTTMRIASQQKSLEGDEEYEFELEDCKQPPIVDVIHINEVSKAIYNSLGEDERKIFVLLQNGYTAEGIAGKLGILISRVRHTIYEKIQKNAIKFIDC